MQGTRIKTDIRIILTDKNDCPAARPKGWLVPGATLSLKGSSSLANGKGLLIKATSGGTESALRPSEWRSEILPKCRPGLRAPARLASEPGQNGHTKGKAQFAF